jgi:predicted phosphodiesterase
MRYGIFSDVHSNLEAFTAALEYYKKEKIDA